MTRGMRLPDDITDTGLYGAVSQSRFWIRTRWEQADPYQLHIRLLRHAVLLERLESLKRRKA